MMTEKNCKIVGCCCVLFGLVLLITSSIFLSYLVKFNTCYSSGHSNFQNGYHDDNDKYAYGSHYVEKRDISSGAYVELCSTASSLIFCAGFALTIALIQMILSGLLYVAQKKNSKIFCSLWVIGHMLICIALITVFAIDLSYDEWKNGYQEKKRHERGSQEVGFLVVVALDFALLIPFIGCVFYFLVKRSAYHDYTPNDQDHPIVFRPQ